MFAPQLLEAYHRKHPKNQPCPTKTTTMSQGKLIHSLFSCLATPVTPLTNRHRLPNREVPSKTSPHRPPPTWVKSMNTKSSYRHHISHRQPSPQWSESLTARTSSASKPSTPRKMTQEPEKSTESFPTSSPNTLEICDDLTQSRHGSNRIARGRAPI